MSYQFGDKNHEITYCSSTPFELAVYLDNRYLSTEDAEFVTFVTADIGSYLQTASVERILLFPPVTSYHRLLIHKTAEDFPGLASFSVGEGNSRRTVVCLALSLLRGEKGRELMSQPPEPHVRKGRGRGRGTSRGSPSPSGLSQREGNPRPGQTSETVTQEGVPSANRERRLQGTRFVRERKKPDVQIYVPRGRRLQQGNSSEADWNEDQQTREDQRLHRDSEESCTSTRESLGSPSEQRPAKSGRKARPEMQRYVPRARRQPASEHTSDRVRVPESWDNAFDSPADTLSVQGNIGDSPKNSSFKRFKSESPPCDKKVDQVSEVKSEIPRPAVEEKQKLERPDIQSSSETLSDSYSEKQSLHSSSGKEFMSPAPHRTLPDVVQGTFSENVSSKLNDTPLMVPYTKEGSSSHTSQNNASQDRNSEEASTVLPESQQYAESSKGSHHQTVPVSSSQAEPTESHNTDSTPDSLGVYVVEEKDLSTLEVDITEVYHVHDTVCAIPGTSHGLNHGCIESQKDVSAPGIQQESEACGDNTESMSDKSESIQVLTTDITAEKLKTTCVEDQKETTICPPSSESSGERMEDGNVVERTAEEVTVGLNDTSHSVISNNKTVSDQDIGNDLKSQESQDATDDVLEKSAAVPEPVLVEPKHLDDYDVESLEIEKQLKAQAIAALDFSEPGTGSQEEEEEDSWDKMFDDNGDCLDPSLIQELTAHVGKVQIDKPKIDYLNFQPKEPDIDMEMYGHIIEIYDFPSEFLTRDLISAFKDFMSRGFDIKWVDDTHALGVFASSIAAQDALRLNNPFMKVRSLAEASRQSKIKARKNQEFLQPFKARPETSASAARRLVSGALGLQAQIPREKREMERKQLKEAKEKRRKERRLKQDMWDGSFGHCAMDQEG